MKCPIDGVDLVMSERQGIEIDYCPKCRGVWLDRGELDKMIERSAAELPKPRSDAHHNRHSDYELDERYQEGDRRRYRKRKSSFLGDLFEFGD